MLVLSRKTGQIIIVGPDIEVEVREIRGDKVRIGITAPRELPVHREELWLQIHPVPKQPWGCTHCGLVEHHVRPHGGEERMICTQCGRVFVRIAQKVEGVS